MKKLFLPFAILGIMASSCSQEEQFMENTEPTFFSVEVIDELNNVKMCDRKIIFQDYPDIDYLTMNGPVSGLFDDIQTKNSLTIYSTTGYHWSQLVETGTAYYMNVPGLENGYYTYNRYLFHKTETTAQNVTHIWPFMYSFSADKAMGWSPTTNMIGFDIYLSDSGKFDLINFTTVTDIITHTDTGEPIGRTVYAPRGNPNQFVFQYTYANINWE